MPGVAKVVVRIPWVIDVARGPVSSNQLHFGTSGPMDATTIIPIFDAVEELFSTGFDGLWSSVLAPTYTITAYDAMITTGTMPFATRESVLTPGTDSTVTEAALTMSYRAAYEVGVKKQRFRGRISVGPLAASTVDGTGHLTTATMDTSEAGLVAFRAAIGAEPNWAWVIGSAALGWKANVVFKLANEPGTVRRRQNTRTDVRTILA